MNLKISKSKGQTFTEFILVFVVLLLATNGVLAMYKKFWKSRYEKTGIFSGPAAAAAKAAGAGEVNLPLAGKIKTDYVK